MKVPPEKLSKRLKKFTYRKETIRAGEIFPKFDIKKLQEYVVSGELVGVNQRNNPHQLILDTCLNLWDGGYSWFLDKFGFYQKSYGSFSGHCHQITPILGMVLKTLGFTKVAYLECYRVDPETLKKIDPKDEPNKEKRQEFTSIKRIPYCCLEVEVEGQKFYLTGKHIKKVGGVPTALLTPVCYREVVGILPHQADPSKSGIYLETKRSDKGEVIWKKQTNQDPKPEYFKTYLYLTLEF